MKLSPKQEMYARSFQAEGRAWFEYAQQYRERGIYGLIKYCMSHSASCYASAREIMGVE